MNRNAAPAPASREPSASEFARGWPVVLSGVIGMMIQAFAFVSVGTMMVPLSEEFGWNRTQIVAVVSFSAALSIVFTPLVGKLIDRYGPRPVALAGFVLQPLSLAAAGLSTANITSWWGIWLIITIANYLIGPPVWAYAATQAFSRRRGIAIGLVLSGMGIANSFVPLFLATTIEILGWRGAYAALAVFGGVLGLSSTLIFFRLPQRPDERVASARGSNPAPAAMPVEGIALGQALRASRFWRIAVMLLLVSAAVGTLNLHFQAILIDRKATLLEAAALAALFGPAQIVGRLSGGFMLDRLSGPMLGCVVFLLPVVSCLLIANGAVYGPMGMLVPILVGYAAGLELDLGAYFTSRYFGTHHFGAIFSAIFVFFTIGYTLGPLLAAYVRDVTGSYQSVLHALIVLLPFAAILSATMGRYVYSVNSGH